MAVEILNRKSQNKLGCAYVPETTDIQSSTAAESSSMITFTAIVTVNQKYHIRFVPSIIRKLGL